jgi:hypothetical protein
MCNNACSDKAVTICMYSICHVWKYKYLHQTRYAQIPTTCISCFVYYCYNWLSLAVCNFLLPCVCNSLLWSAVWIALGRPGICHIFLCQGYLHIVRNCTVPKTTTYLINLVFTRTIDSNVKLMYHTKLIIHHS